jgi:hypothetical protein
MHLILRGSLPIADGRSSEANFVRRLRASLAEQVGGSPNASQQILIDRVATLALRVRLIDANPDLPDRVEYLDLTRLLAELLAQLGAQQAPSTTMHRQSEAAA